MPNIALIPLVVFGIGFLIFIHELGHFVVAKLTGIRVLAFSIGFGPRVLGFRRGETDYRLSLFPIGGYVKMVGEGPDSSQEIVEGDFRSKTVGQRAAVIVAGVVMNAICAFLIFATAFSIGVPFGVPVIGEAEKGTPAWEAGLESGTRVLSINGNPIYEFTDIVVETALSKAGTPLKLKLSEDENPPFEKEIVPRKDPSTGTLAIGISAPLGPIVIEPGSRSFEQGIRTGDTLVSINNQPIRSLPSIVRVQSTLERYKGEELPEILLTLDGEDGRREIPFHPEWKESEAFQIKIAQMTNRVTAIQEVDNTLPFDLKEEDILKSLDGHVIETEAEFRSAVTAASIGVAIALEILRDGTPRTLSGTFENDAARESFFSRIALGANENFVKVLPDGPAARAGVESWDRVASINGKRTDTFREIQKIISSQKSGATVTMGIERGDSRFEVDVQPELFTRLAPDFDWKFRQQVETLRVTNLAKACSVGFARTVYFGKHVYVMLRRMVVDRTVPTENIGGILTIGYVSYKLAESGFTKLLYFLGLLSVNLAILNLLPIPVLDGGQLVFLLIEKIKGSPVSERVFQYAQFAGLIILLALIIYVTYNDIRRLIPMFQ